ncbi:uncharacterized protein LOC127281599 isoform X2 [Leptopilina boulardi]|uniref:uncharacterized protein LOC127281599 isoform X2 n=1 Tax=Leptopilina boulardi TaxID=63433 RepID=UPI0021F57DD9|nr:uncharacterized protein LOC127281599 isoform X2 [Leptopilina boulardi]
MNVNNIFILFILSVVINNYQLITAQPDDDDIEKKYDPGSHCIRKEKIKKPSTESSEVNQDVYVDYYFCHGKYHGYLEEEMAKKYCIDKNNKRADGSYMCRTHPFIWNGKSHSRNIDYKNDDHSKSFLKALKEMRHFKKSSGKNPDDVEFTGYDIKDEAIDKCISKKKVNVNFGSLLPSLEVIYSFCYGNKHIYRSQNDALKLCINQFSNNKYKCKIHPDS